jgi:hypothetical protein
VVIFCQGIGKINWDEKNSWKKVSFQKPKETEGLAETQICPEMVLERIFFISSSKY